jgi:hypothetical protein
MPARATAVLAAEHVRTRGEAEQRVALRVAKALGATPGSWPAVEREAFERIAPVLALLPGMARWPGADRRSLLAMIRAKGGAQERDFALAAAAHPRFFPRADRRPPAGPLSRRINSGVAASYV